MKIEVFWDIAPFQSVKSYRRFGEYYCLLDYLDSEHGGGNILYESDLKHSRLKTKKKRIYNFKIIL
jgi:hypothetical protein